jgi:hypothetical protein
MPEDCVENSYSRSKMSSRFSNRGSLLSGLYAKAPKGRGLEQMTGPENKTEVASLVYEL